MERLKTEDFDHDFIEVVERLANTLKVKPAVMLENIFIRRLAEERAVDDVFGKRPHLMPEFMTYGGKVKRGHELYEILYNLKRLELERERVPQILATGIPFDMLPPEDQKILKRHGQDSESKAKQKEIDRQADEYLKENPIILDSDLTKE